MEGKPSQADLVRNCSRLVYEGFRRYDKNFRRVTRRAARHFVARDWASAQDDHVERLELWDKSLSRTVSALEVTLPGASRNRELWHRIKEFYGERIDDFAAAEFARTFFTSVTRRLFATVGVDPLTEFVLELDPEVHHEERPDTRVFINWGDLEALFGRVLEDFAFKAPYEDSQRDAQFIRDEVVERAWRHYRHPNTLLRVEVIAPVFYQSTRAFLVGKVDGEGWTAPFAIGFEHRESGIAVSAVYMSDPQMHNLFGFTRSYFFVDLESVRSVVHYVEALMPDKPIDEIYSMLGRIRQGKTERYRQLARHLDRSEDTFVRAPGAKGMVMIVFTLPNYHLVFKVIRDRFGHGKKVTRRQVIERYRLVSRQDRVGRLIDVQAFRHLAFPKDRFSDEVLDELLSQAARTVRISGERVIFDHLYMERKVRPLNLFLGEVSPQRARDAIKDYGQSIKDMAVSNIFPGDMLVKNFGVTRYGRVIFYDFDEVTLLTDCRFRALPDARDDIMDMSDQTWFKVADEDVFPEQFRSFLGVKGELENEFFEHHRDLLDPDYWSSMQAAHLPSDSAGRAAGGKAA